MPKQLLLPLTFDAAACLLLLQKKTVMVDCSSKQASLPFFYYTYYIQGGEERQCVVCTPYVKQCPILTFRTLKWLWLLQKLNFLKMEVKAFFFARASLFHDQTPASLRTALNLPVVRQRHPKRLHF